ncbi:hypothetical protein GCM10027168_45800 [Streptomyces capparidis]
MVRRTRLWRRTASSVLAGLVTSALLASGQAGAATGDRGAPAAAEGAVNRAFAAAAEEYDVPRDLLVAVGYGETRLDGHQGRPSQAGGYGVMHLVSNPERRTLEQAAELTGAAPAELRRDTPANIRGGAAVLRARADALGLDAAERDRVGAWYPVVAEYGGADRSSAARLYADAVYDILARGASARVAGGERVAVAPREVRPERGRYARSAPSALSPDYPPARWVPANSGNYQVGRSSAITTVVVHVTQGSYAGTISWFQNPSSNVSAHYVVRSSDGEVTQMVRDADTAWHARSGNPYSLGIEHEGYVDNPAWFTDSMYRASADLTRYLCDHYGIPKDRAHIVGHNEVPNNDHTDPGPHWDWNRYMELVRGGSGGTPVQLDFASYETQRSGATGGQVRAVQYLLNQQGFDAGTVDGVFGARTESAVKAFQTNRRLTADGVVGARTWTALLSAGTTPLLQQGSTGAAVQRLQRALTAALGRTVAVDGVFGSGTGQAVRDYQSSRGLGVDGVVGGATWSALQAGR